MIVAFQAFKQFEARFGPEESLIPGMTPELFTRTVLKIKQVLLDSCSSKRMQVEDKHKPLDQSSQPSTDPEASNQYSDSFPLISFKSQQVMSPTAAFAMLEPEKRSLLLTGKNYTLWAFWMRGRLLKKGLGVICLKMRRILVSLPKRRQKRLTYCSQV